MRRRANLMYWFGTIRQSPERSITYMFVEPDSSSLTRPYGFPVLLVKETQENQDFSGLISVRYTNVFQVYHFLLYYFK